MKNIISKLFGVNVYATSKNVQGRKSIGAEDRGLGKNWRADYDDLSTKSTN